MPRIRPLPILLVYILAIPSCGLIYSSISGEFYQSTTGSEVEAHRLREEIQRELLVVVKEVYKYPQKEGFGYQLNDLSVEGLSCGASVISFTTPFVRGVPRSHVNLTFRPIWTIDSDPIDKYGRYVVHIERVPPFMVESFKKNHDPGPGSTFEYRWGPLVAAEVISGSEGSLSSISGLIYLSDLEEHVLEYAAICSGSPRPLRGSLWRFMYLSAVTITTLGFGDIVPVTDRARILVGMEAVFGVLTVSYFFYRISDRSKGA